MMLDTVLAARICDYADILRVKHVLRAKHATYLDGFNAMTSRLFGLLTEDDKRTAILQSNSMVNNQVTASENYTNLVCCIQSLRFSHLRVCSG